METTPDTKRRKSADSALQPSEPRITVAPDVREGREPLPTIPEIDPALARDTAFPHDTIPAPPLAEHDELED